MSETNPLAPPEQPLGQVTSKRDGRLFQSAGAVLMFHWVGIGIALALLAAGAAAKYLADPNPPA